MMDTNHIITLDHYHCFYVTKFNLLYYLLISITNINTGSHINICKVIGTKMYDKIVYLTNNYNTILEVFYMVCQ